jgi:ketosteroid isomerase-like protein
MTQKCSDRRGGARFAALFVAVTLLGCAQPRPTAPVGPEIAVRAVLTAQVAAWNRGDLAGFMEGYARGDATRFASGGEVTAGWQTVFDRYQRRYHTAEAMGQLTFSEVVVTPLTDEAAFVFGHWSLARAQDQPHGLFTLLFRRSAAGWQIVHDHTSSASP